MGIIFGAKNEYSNLHDRIDRLQSDLLDNETIRLLGFRNKSLAKVYRRVLLPSRASPICSLHSALDH
jgi:hypothetical protein